MEQKEESELMGELEKKIEETTIKKMVWANTSIMLTTLTLCGLIAFNTVFDVLVQQGLAIEAWPGKLISGITSI